MVLIFWLCVQHNLFFMSALYLGAQAKNESSFGWLS
jgi:hypothetical protein